MMIDAFKSLAWTDYFLYVITDPRELYRRIKQKDPDPFQMSFAVPAATAFFDILALSMMGSETAFFYYKISYGWILIYIYEISKSVIYSALVDVTAQFYGNRGNIREIISLANFAFFPKIFFLPVMLFFTVLNFAPGFFYVFFSIIFFVWYVMIFVQGLSEMHSIDFGRSFIIMLIPVLFIWVTMFLISILLVITGIGLVTTV